MSRNLNSGPTAPPRLRTGGMSPLAEEENTVPSPARGRETRTALLQKLRPPPLVHAWDCWIERPPVDANNANASTAPATSTSTSAPYTPHLTHLVSVTDVRGFWSLFNNLPLSTLPHRHTCYLFHRGVRPLWEDPRNYRGGCWTFRMPRAVSAAFFTELCLLAIGEQLQNAVEDSARTKFRDDICGVSFSPRNATVTVVSVWNRDAGNEEGKERLLRTVLDGVGEEMRPKDGSWYYKRHDEHAGFVAPGAAAKGDKATGGTDGTKPNTSTTTADVKKAEEDAEATEPSTTASTADMIEADVRKVRRILDELKISKDSNGEADAQHAAK